jgi:hypothetical protein
MCDAVVAVAAAVGGGRSQVRFLLAQMRVLVESGEDNASRLCEAGLLLSLLSAFRSTLTVRRWVHYVAAARASP